LGDSLTAAFGAGATSIFSVFTEYRGMAFSAGGDNNIQSIYTLPNMLKLYNSKVTGFSVKTGKTNSPNSKLNIAVTGAVSQDILGQAQEAVIRLKADPAYDINNSWKMITIFIGANNLCDVCKDPIPNSAATLQTSLVAALDYLQQHVPHAFVSLIPAVDVTALGVIESFFCGVLHPWLCDCAVSKEGNNQQITKQAAADMAAALYTIQNMAKYQTEDFAVIVQPFFQNVTLPTKSDGSVDTSYFAPDCFHFSQIGHANSAQALWNNLFEKVGTKQPYWKINQPTYCPPAGTLLPTTKN